MNVWLYLLACLFWRRGGGRALAHNQMRCRRISKMKAELFFCLATMFAALVQVLTARAKMAIRSMLIVFDLIIHETMKMMTAGEYRNTNTDVFGQIRSTELFVPTHPPEVPCTARRCYVHSTCSLQQLCCTRVWSRPPSVMDDDEHDVTCIIFPMAILYGLDDEVEPDQPDIR